MVRRLTRPTAAITAQMATSTIMTVAKLSRMKANCGSSAPPDAAAMSPFADSSATANIVTSVTPMTTPIAMRLERSG